MATRGKAVQTVREETARVLDELRTMPPDTRRQAASIILDSGLGNLLTLVERQLWRDKRALPELRAMAELMHMLNGAWQCYKATAEAEKKGAPNGAPEQP